MFRSVKALVLLFFYPKNEVPLVTGFFTTLFWLWLFITCQIFTFKNVLTLHTYTVLIFTTKSKVYYRKMFTTIRFWLKTLGTLKYQKKSDGKVFANQICQNVVMISSTKYKNAIKIYLSMPFLFMQSFGKCWSMVKNIVQNYCLACARSHIKFSCF